MDESVRIDPARRNAQDGCEIYVETAHGENSNLLPRTRGPASSHFPSAPYTTRGSAPFCSAIAISPDTSPGTDLRGAVSRLHYLVWPTPSWRWRSRGHGAGRHPWSPLAGPLYPVNRRWPARCWAHVTRAPPSGLVVVPIGDAEINRTDPPPHAGRDGRAGARLSLFLSRRPVVVLFQL